MTLKNGDLPCSGRSDSGDLAYILLHPAGAGCLHGIGNMAVNIQRKGRRSMAEVPLHRLHVVPVLQREHRVGVAQIVNSGVRRANLGGELLENLCSFFCKTVR